MEKSKKKRKIHRHSEKIGLPPGTLDFIGIEEDKDYSIYFIEYNNEEFNFIESDKLKKEFLEDKKGLVKWINIDGYSKKIVKKMGETYNLHPLLLEDILSLDQRPKIEYYNDTIAVFLKCLYWNRDKSEVRKEQISLILQGNSLVSFIQSKDMIFNPIFERLKQYQGRIRQFGVDYLLYALIDIVIDNYYIILEDIDEVIEQLDENIEAGNIDNISDDIKNSRTSLISLRKSLWPVRDVINNILRDSGVFIKDETKLFFKDILDHILFILDTIDGQKDSISNLRDSYNSAMSNKMNQIINLLTIISSIFIPITFLAGLYGMNFVNIPELRNTNGYFILLIVMVLISGSMLFYFKKKKWL